jgi:hypothetical protein
VVQFIAPALLCTIARSVIATADQPKPVSSARIAAAQGYPEKQFRKTSLR